MGWAAAFAVAGLTLGACGDPGNVPPPPDVSVTEDSGTPADLGVGEDAPSPGFCARALCLAGTTCCEATQSCLPAGVRCPTDPPPPPDAGVRCRSNGDCAASQYCDGAGCDTVGACTARPTICTREYAPVCGCDGRTYGNACSAAAAGVRVRARGECAAADAGVDAALDAGPRRCVTARECGAREECVYASGACATSGTCEAAIACLRAETFCSCAGETYLGCRPDRPTRGVGACPAVDAGVPDVGFCATVRCVAGTVCCEATRSCLPAGTPCPGTVTRCRANADCASGQYCAGDGCDTAGTCAARPGACPDVYAPVCGCDGRTYGNSCEAAAGGARVAASGSCATSRRCATARDCGTNQECVYAASACATSGTCEAAIACLRAETFCSCAGETYLGCRPDRPTRSTGACAAVDAGVPDAGSFCAAVLCAAGTRCCEALRSCLPAGVACPVAPPDAGVASCRSNADCGARQYCAGDGCDTAGTCAARPDACTLEYNPVCGCDGRTYGNACGAASAGVRVRARGACP